MTEISKSPERNTFQKQCYITRKIDEGKSLDDPEIKCTIDLYDDWDRQSDKLESDPEWQKNNLEWDLRSTDWILDKVRSSEVYSQNLYAALCNNDFFNRDLVLILKEEYWSCSWRSAGGIIANMREEGDYIDWYCSGIRNDHYQEDSDVPFPPGYVQEGQLTDEVRQDLIRLGWTVVTTNNNDL